MLITQYYPIFSVVIPMYNVSRYIEQCIQSVLDQSFENFEIVCVDDGCSDDTVKKVQAFDDERIRLVCQKNRGLSGARNTGINASRGIYVALLDADDFWHQDKLQSHYDHFNSNPEVGVSYSASSFIDEEGELLGIGQNPKIKNISSKDVLCRNPIGNGSAPVFRSAVLNQVSQVQVIGGELRTCYFDESMRQSEDIEYWLRISLVSSWRFEGIDKPLTYYRVNSGGLSANLNNQYQSWCYAMKKNSGTDPELFKRYFSLAQAYQKRYLSRRAIQQGNYKDAIRLMKEALQADKRLFIEEPARTAITAACACLCFLPERVFMRLQSIGMQLMGRYKIS